MTSKKTSQFRGCLYEPGKQAGPVTETKIPECLHDNFHPAYRDGETNREVSSFSAKLRNLVFCKISKPYTQQFSQWCVQVCLIATWKQFFLYSLYVKQHFFIRVIYARMLILVEIIPASGMNRLYGKNFIPASGMELHNRRDPACRDEIFSI